MTASARTSPTVTWRSCRPTGHDRLRLRRHRELLLLRSRDDAHLRLNWAPGETAKISKPASCSPSRTTAVHVDQRGSGARRVERHFVRQRRFHRRRVLALRRGQRHRHPADHRRARSRQPNYTIGVADISFAYISPADGGGNVVHQVTVRDLNSGVQKIFSWLPLSNAGVRSVFPVTWASGCRTPSNSRSSARGRDDVLEHQDHSGAGSVALPRSDGAAVGTPPLTVRHSPPMADGAIGGPLSLDRGGFGRPGSSFGSGGVDWARLCSQSVQG